MLVTTKREQSRPFHVIFGDDVPSTPFFNETKQDSQWDTLKQRLFEFVAHNESEHEDSESYFIPTNDNDIAYVKHTNDEGWYRIHMLPTTQDEFASFLRNENIMPPAGALSEREFSSSTSQYIKAAFIGYPAAGSGLFADYLVDVCVCDACFGGPPMKYLPIFTTALFTMRHFPPKLRECERNDGMWESYKRSFITLAGRVVDTANNHISHSEGQGYGMLMAAHYDDKATFDKLWRWTQRHLQRDVDPLFSWKWQPNKPHVPDVNNASDGDVLIAWALMRADEKWPEQDYERSARNIARSLKNSHIQKIGGETVLLPGSHGFSFDHRTVVNPGYWVYPALASFAKFDKTWRVLSESGLSILSKNLYGEERLTPDWLEYSDKGWQPADTFPSQFSYSNYRIPLYMIWGNRTHPLNRNFANWIAGITVHGLMLSLVKKRVTRRRMVQKPLHNWWKLIMEHGRLNKGFLFCHKEKTITQTA
nr:glycosyl hydrolase family 8 [Enterovibrio nigricans]